MKFFLALFMLLISFAAEADTVVESVVRSKNWVRAQDGTEVTLTFDKTEIVNVGDSRETHAVRPTVRVKNSSWHHDHGGKAIRVVFLGFCRWDQEPSEVDVFSDAFDLSYTHLQDGSGFGYERQTAYDLQVAYKLKSGGRRRCRQEVAVVVDGNWLVDPISGGHNFHVDMVAAPAE